MEKWKEKKRVWVNEHEHPGKRKGMWLFDVDLTLEQHWRKSLVSNTHRFA